MKLIDRLIPMPASFALKDLHRFWAFTNRNGPGGCWLWTGGLASRPTDAYGSYKDPYGRFLLAREYYKAHRVAYFFEYRVAPDRMEVCHECNVTLCVRPDHLFLGTHGDNMKHRADSGRHPVGSFSHNAVLEESEVRLIKLKIAAGESYLSISRTHGVVYATIKYIGLGKTWKHVKI